MRPILGAVALLAALTTSASSSTFVVDPSGGGDYLTIQEGVDAASEGDTVLVAPGTYSGAGNYNIDFGGTNLVLMSVAGPESTVIDVPTSTTTYAVHLSSGEDTTSVFRGFTCRTTAWSFAPIIYLNGTSGLRVGLTVEDCVLSHRGIYVSYGTAVVRRTQFDECRTAGHYGGGMSCWHSTVIVDDSLFSFCSVGSALGGYGTGISLSYCDARIARVRFEYCVAGDVFGTLYSEYSSVDLRCATFWENSADYDIQVRGGSLDATNVTLTRSSRAAIKTEYSAAVDIENSIIAFNRAPFSGAAGTTVTHSCVFGNTLGDSLSCAHASNMFVDPLFCDLTGGVVTLASGSPCLPENCPWGELVGSEPYGCSPREILVAPDGTGDFPTIQAAIDSADVWDEVVLADGVYTGDGNRDLDYLGKRLTVRSEHGDPAMCVIECGGSEAEPHRGVSFVTGEGDGSVLDGVTIAGGYATRGGGIYCSGTRPRILNCVIRDNEAVVGGGLYAMEGGGAAFVACVFVSNAADSGGGCAVSEPYGGGEDAQFTRCTIAGNTAAAGAGLLCRAYGWNATLSENSVVAFNGPGEGVWSTAADEESLYVTYTDIFGNEGGDWIGDLVRREHRFGNITDDPLFCEGGFSLVEDCSPCLGAGSDGGSVGLIEAGCACGDPTGVDGEPAALQLISVSNPARETCRFSFYRAGPPADITLTIYNVEGRRVAELTLPAQRSGLGSVRWNCTDSSGSRVASGVYPYQISDGTTTARGLVTVVR